MPTFFQVQPLIKSLGTLKFGIDLSGGTDLLIQADLSEVKTEEEKQKKISRVIEVIRSRIDTLGVAEPQIQKVGLNRIRVQLPGVKSVERTRELVTKSSKLTMHLISRSQSPQNNEENAFWAKTQDGYDLQVEEKVWLTGEDIEGASISISENGQPEVRLDLSNQGAKNFSNLTSSQNRGRGIAVLLDHVLVTEMEVGDPVYGKYVSIEMPRSLNRDEKMALADEISIVLKSGNLPVPVEVVEERSVGPTLGKDSIRQGQLAIILSLSVVFLFLLFKYKWLGVISGFSMVFNLSLVLGGLALIDAVLTFSGLAGLVLIVGMGIDSNILVFERLKEVGRKNVTQAFNETRSAVVDASMTTALPALVLFYFGNGPIRGFATVMLLGLVSSYLSTFVFSRLFVEWRKTAFQ